jgi:hypothetical protein
VPGPTKLQSGPPDIDCGINVSSCELIVFVNSQASEHCSGPEKLADTKLTYQAIAWYGPKVSHLFLSICVAPETYHELAIDGIALLYLVECILPVRYFCSWKCRDLVAIWCRYACNGTIGYRTQLTCHLQMLASHLSTTFQQKQSPYR